MLQRLDTSAMTAVRCDPLFAEEWEFSQPSQAAPASFTVAIDRVLLRSRYRQKRAGLIVATRSVWLLGIVLREKMQLSSRRSS